MQIKITWKYAIAFIALDLVMMELHEQAHIQVGRMICGCYGERDFNVWHSCAECTHPALAYLATLAGPLFTYAMIWLGAWWLTKSESSEKRTIGFSLVFANMAFARIFTALIGGGDEITVLKYGFADSLNITAVKKLGAVIVLLFCMPPLIIALKNISNERRLWYFAGFSILPMLFGLFYVFIFLNGLLKKGFLSATMLLGTPTLILLHTGLMVLVLTGFSRNLLKVNANLSEEVGAA